MIRKKVKSESLTESGPKKRPEVKEEIKKEYPEGWNKIVNVQGKIVRHRMYDKKKSVEMGDLISKGKAKKLYSAVDGNDTYFYYELLD